MDLVDTDYPGIVAASDGKYYYQKWSAAGYHLEETPRFPPLLWPAVPMTDSFDIGDHLFLDEVDGMEEPFSAGARIGPCHLLVIVIW